MDNSTQLSVKRVPLEAIHQDPTNVRLHDERGLEALKGSLARFGQQKPIVVDRRGTIRAGNGTFAAAKALGWTEIQVVETDLEGIEAVAYSLADNRLSDMSRFSEPDLANLLKELRAEDALLGTGFDDADMDGKQRITTFHPTSKPTRLFEIPLEQHTRAGAIVLEPFCGSGSQIIAAEKLRRRCFACDLQPAFVDGTIQRWQKATGKAATLESTGQTFEAVAAERRAS